jgi:hypothetical protein
LLCSITPLLFIFFFHFNKQKNHFIVPSVPSLAAFVWSRTIYRLEVTSGLCFRSKVLHTQ